MINYNEYFIDIKLSSKTVYVYSVRKLLQKAIDKNLDKFGGVLLDLGCGEMPYKQYLLDRNQKIAKYIGMDIDYSEYHQSIKPDMYWDGKNIALGNGKVDTVMATEFFEHIPNIETVLREINRVLTKDGLLFFTVPFIWPLHETPYDEYRYTPYSLSRVLLDTGFTDIVISPMGGYDAALAQMLCLWSATNNGKIATPLRRKLFGKFEKIILYPIIEKLLERDAKSNVTFYGENTMAPGFYGYAKK